MKSDKKRIASYDYDDDHGDVYNSVYSTQSRIRSNIDEEETEMNFKHHRMSCM